MRNPRFEREDDIVPLERPDIDAIPCKDCAFRAEDGKIGNMEIPGAAKGCCKAFEYKPYELEQQILVPNPDYNPDMNHVKGK